MDFESPDVMKDFPGLYSTEVNKKSNDSDYSDDVNEKTSKKDLLIGKRKDKKDTKKDRGYAALEGESSAEEDVESKSPSKTKKTKSFKFTTKNKEKRDKVRDKEKDFEKKKDKETKKNERCKEKIKCDKKDKKSKLLNEENIDISDVLPIFGVSLELSVERSKCHDGINLPLPVRNCIDYVQEHGISVENVYKIDGLKSKILHIKKMYNQREDVHLTEYDVATATSVLKMFFRELPEPILGDFLTRFEEAGAIPNVASREIGLLTLVENLPEYNRVLLAWIILHLDTITNNEKMTKMNAQSIAMTLSPILQMSHRLLAALLCHCKSLFKDTLLLKSDDDNIFVETHKLFRENYSVFLSLSGNFCPIKYCPPLMSSTLQLPEGTEDIVCELRKQESLLSQIHAEMNSGFISKKREELLWEVQRMITQLKRTLRSIQKCHEISQKSLEECLVSEESKMTKSLSCSDDDILQVTATVATNKGLKMAEHISNPNNVKYLANNNVNVISDDINTNDSETQNSALCKVTAVPEVLSIIQKSQAGNEQVDMSKPQISESGISLIQHQNTALVELKDSLLSQIAAEKSEIVLLKYCIANNQQHPLNNTYSSNVDYEKLDEIMDLIIKENKILQIKKIDLVREIMEQREACIYLQATISMSSNII